MCHNFKTLLSMNCGIQINIFHRMNIHGLELVALNLVVYMLWFNFILGLNFTFLCFWVW